MTNESEVIENSDQNSSGEGEKLLAQYDVNKIVQREKHNASDRTRRELEKEYNSKIQALQAEKDELARQLSTTAQAQNQLNQNVSGQLSYEDIIQRVRQETERDNQQRQLEEQVQQIAHAYKTKMAEGPSKYEDFNDVVQDFDPSAFPNLVLLVSGLDNAAEIIYDLSKNPTKLINLNMLAEKSPKLAHNDLLKLSNSIKQNRDGIEAASQYNSPNPLDRIKPSLVSGGNGQMSFNDLLSADWLRG